MSPSIEWTVFRNFHTASVLLSAASMRTNPGGADGCWGRNCTKLPSTSHLRTQRSDKRQNPCNRNTRECALLYSNILYGILVILTGIQTPDLADSQSLCITYHLRPSRTFFFGLVSTIENRWNRSYSVPVLSSPGAYRRLSARCALRGHKCLFSLARFTIDGNWCPVAFPRPCLPLQPLFLG